MSDICSQCNKPLKAKCEIIAIYRTLKRENKSLRAFCSKACREQAREPAVKKI